MVKLFLKLNFRYKSLSSGTCKNVRICGSSEKVLKRNKFVQIFFYSSSIVILNLKYAVLTKWLFPSPKHIVIEKITKTVIIKESNFVRIYTIVWFYFVNNNKVPRQIFFFSVMLFSMFEYKSIRLLKFVWCVWYKKKNCRSDLNEIKIVNTPRLSI